MSFIFGNKDDTINQTKRFNESRATSCDVKMVIQRDRNKLLKPAVSNRLGSCFSIYYGNNALIIHKTTTDKCFASRYYFYGSALYVVDRTACTESSSKIPS